MSNTTTDSSLRKVTLDSLRFGRNFLNMMLEKTPDEMFLKTAFEGANNAAWVVGHLASTDNYFLKALAGDAGALPESWDELFGMNSSPKTDAGDYPSRDELVAAMNERREKLEAWLSERENRPIQLPYSNRSNRKQDRVALTVEQQEKLMAYTAPEYKWLDGLYNAQEAIERLAS